MEVFFIVRGEPKSKQRPRFANGHAYTPEETRVAEQRIKYEYLGKFGPKKIDGPVQVVLEFYLGTRRVKDLDNLEKLVLDALNGLAYDDDSQVVLKTASKHFSKTVPPQTRISVRGISEA